MVDYRLLVAHLVGEQVLAHEPVEAVSVELGVDAGEGGRVDMPVLVFEELGLPLLALIVLLEEVDDANSVEDLPIAGAVVLNELLRSRFELGQVDVLAHPDDLSDVQRVQLACYAVEHVG